MIERTNVFSEMYEILGFSSFLYLPQITQYIFFIFLVIENILVFFYHSCHSHQEKIIFHNQAKSYLLT